MPDREDKRMMVITPHKGVEINLKELWHYRDLIGLFVRRDFVATYKQTVLGPLWFLLQPLFSTIVFTFVFGQIARIPTDGVPPMLFYMAGIVSWNYFSSCISKTSDTFSANAGIFGKVYFPRLTVPLSVVITNLIAFLIQFGFFLFFLIFFYLRGSDIRINIFVFLVPVLILQMGMLGFGVGMFVSSLTTRYRDLSYLVGFGIQLWMYATPIVYPMSQIPERWRWLFAFNPMAVVIETFRYAFLGSGSFRPVHLAISFGITILVLIIGIVPFSRIEKTFMDTV